MGRTVNPAAVRALREALGIRVSDLARDVEISTAYLCNIEAGRKTASAHVLRRLADRMGVPLDAITSPTVVRPDPNGAAA